MTKNSYIYFNYETMKNSKSGAAVEAQTGYPEIAGSGPTCASYFALGMASRLGKVSLDSVRAL